MLRLLSRSRVQFYALVSTNISRTLSTVHRNMANSIALDSQAQGSKDLLGYHLPLNLPTDWSKWKHASECQNNPFDNGIEWAGTPITLRERAMIAFIAQITDKNNWERKVYDQGILQKWRSERTDLERDLEARGQDHGFSEKMMDYVSGAGPS